MRLEKHEEESRRISVVNYLDGDPKLIEEIAKHEGTLSQGCIPTYISRLRDRGIKVISIYKGRFLAYNLDMPLEDALKLVVPKGYTLRMMKIKKLGTPKEIKARQDKIRRQKAAEKALKEFVPSEEYHPLWIYITRPQTIDCRIKAKE